MGKTLYLEKRGCNFFANDNISDVSDVGNYRVGCYKNRVVGKDGNKYILEFTEYDKYTWRNTHKKTGKPLKHLKRELVLAHALHVSTEYDRMTEYGIPLSFANLNLEREMMGTPRLYTLKNILVVVNEISVDKYDQIEFL